MKIVLVLFLGLFLSYFGEKRAITFEYLPRLPKAEKINFHVISSKMTCAVLFGGFRGIIVDLLWMQIDNLWHHARFYKLPPLYELVTMIQPEYINGWVMGGWHMAYNMSYELPKTPNISVQLKNKIELQWVFRGIEFLKSGNELNPDNAEILFEIGWTYYHRLKDYNSSIKWFELSTKKNKANDVTWRLIAFAFEKSGDIETAYKKWVELKKHSQYDDITAKKIIDRNIERLQNIISKH